MFYKLGLKNMEERLNQAGLVKALGHTKGYISRLVKQGVIKLDEDGKTTLEEAKAGIEKNADPTKAYSTKAYKENVNKKIEKMTDDDKEILIANMSDPDYIKEVFGLSYADARTRNEQIDILINTVKLEKEQGKLVPIEQVKNDAFEIGKKLKEGLLNIPDRICDYLASEKDPAKIHNIITKEIKEVLEEIAEALKK